MHAFQQLVGMLTGCLLMLPVVGAVFLQVPAPFTTLEMASPEIETVVKRDGRWVFDRWGSDGRCY